MRDQPVLRTDERALIVECLEQRVWAVVGASTNPSKWGYRVYKALQGRGYRVYPVNPRAKQIEGEACYPSLAALPEQPDVVSVIIPPKLGLALANQAADAGIARLWFQPGAASPENVAHAASLGLRVVSGSCVLVALGKS
ncbi:MAG TPA: CoA-binding protein [Thermomicrobiales bacterium]